MFRSNHRVSLLSDGTTEQFVPVGSNMRIKPIDASTGSAAVGVRATLEPIEVEKSAKNNREGAEVADIGGGLPGNTQVNEIVAVGIMSDVLDGMINQNTSGNRGDGSTTQHAKVNTMLNRTYADIYYNDAISGSTVDLLSTLPFSEFSLTGFKDQKHIEPYLRSIESLNPVSLLPSISIDFLVLGAFLGSLSWNESKDVFHGILPHNIDYATIRPVPVFGVDPLIDIIIPKELSQLLQDNDSRLESIKHRIPDGFSTQRDTTVKLDPNDTIFIPRRALLKDFAGVSLYRRVLPAWFVEKALIKGTIDQVYKRQRGALHITVSDTETAVSTNADMTEIGRLFLNIDLDPMGALIVTRDNVNVNEVRRGDDFWKWTDSVDALTTIKLRAMGISESFVTGEASWNTMDATLSVMMEMIRNYRALVTNELFYSKIFPAIAMANGHSKKLSVETASNAYADYIQQDAKSKGFFVENAGSIPNVQNFDPTRYAMPKLQWHKRLMPEADEQYIGMLNTLKENGIPIPVRILSAAGGLKMETIFESMDQDIRDRKRLAKYAEELAQFAPKEEEQSLDEGGGGGDEGEEASIRRFDATALAPIITGGGSLMRRGIGAKRGPVDERLVEPHKVDHRGRPRMTTKKGRDLLTERLHKTIASRASILAQKENASANVPAETTKSYHFIQRKKTKKTKKKPTEKPDGKQSD